YLCRCVDKGRRSRCGETGATSRTTARASDRVRVEGIDKQRLGEVAANVRKIRPPEPHKGKGVRYQGEVIRRADRKAGSSPAPRTRDVHRGVRFDGRRVVPSFVAGRRGRLRQSPCHQSGRDAIVGCGVNRRWWSRLVQL